MRLIRFAYIVIVVTTGVSCKQKLPAVLPTVISEKVPHDSDDPAIWINKSNPEQSIIFGTDKNEENGGVYGFDLNGELLITKQITGLKYPNNVDIEYDLALNDSTLVDIMVFTERENNRIRVYTVPGLLPLDKGGIKVFDDESTVEMKRPMGVALFKAPEDGSIYAIVSRKAGPKDNYLYQYKLTVDMDGSVKGDLVRKFGTFSGQKEIEAIAVDDELGYVYYSDEGVGIRKYYADPEKGNEELSLFGGEYFRDDVEGIAIACYKDGKGYIIVSNQQDHSFNIFRREGDNSYLKTLNLGTIETDGCEVVTRALGEKFPNGLFVSMNDEQNFYFHALDSLKLGY